MDPLPNNGQHFLPEVPDERKKEENDEKNKIAAHLPVLEDIKQWFDEQIKATDSLANVLETTKSYNAQDVSIKEAIVAHSIVSQLMATKRDELVNKITTFKENKR